MSRARVARNTLWELGGGLVATAANFGTFYVLARGFGDERYGVLSGTMALMLLVGPLSAFGAGHLIVRAVNRDGATLRSALTRYLLLAPFGGLAAFVVIVVLRALILPQAPLGLLVALGLAELIASPLITVISEAAQAVEELWISAITKLVARVLRLFAAIVYVVGFDGVSPSVWGVLHLGTALVGGALGIHLLWRHTGGFDFPSLPTARDAADGLPFGISMGSLFVKNEADKFLLLRNNLDSDAGNYTAGYRILTAAQIPTLALANATYARFFDTGADGRSSTRLAVRLTGVAEIYAVATGIFMWVIAPLFPRLLDGFEDSASVIRWLSVVPALLVGQLFAGQSLTGTGRNNIRVALSVSAAVINVALNLRFIPSHQLNGALASTIITETALAITLWIALLTTSPTPTEAPVPQSTE